ncbi:alpha/beta hydrolase [Aeoliella sp.]|uniref:alpha/beta hydrolase n=1 Tax=Aeoliella sp. TaxID=2795800 RepID=UPI003CCBA4E0
MQLAGRLETPWLDSTILADNLPGDPTRRMLPVYLPPGYDDEPQRRFPVIYNLTGHGTSAPMMLNSVAWGENFFERLDRLIATGEAEPIIAVVPDCFTLFGGAQFLNTPALGNYEDYITQEIIPYVDTNFRTLADRQHRGLVGKSSGGYGTMVQGMRHPELFSALASHSGDIYFEFGLLPDLAYLFETFRKHGGIEAFITKIPGFKPKTHRDFWGPIGMLCYGAAYAPDLSAPRGFHLPIDEETGALVDEIWQRWLEWDPVRMIDRPEYLQAYRQMNYIYLDCGYWDDLNFAVGTRVMSKKLTAAGIEHEMELFPDGHTDVSYRYDVSLPRLSRALAG